MIIENIMENKEKTPWEQAGYDDEISWKRALIEEKVRKDYDSKRCTKESLIIGMVHARIAESERMDKIQELEKQVASLKEQLNEQLNKPVDHTSLSFDKMVEEVVKKHLHVEIDCSESGCVTVNNFWDDEELEGSSCWVPNS